MERLQGIMAQLEALRNDQNREAMKRFGIESSKAYGISIPNVRKIARSHKKDHELALALWHTGIHEAMILATIVDDPAAVTEDQVDNWVADFYSWDVCDQACSNLFIHTPWGIPKIAEYTARQEEFVKRAGFVLIAAAAVHLKKEPDETFLRLLDIIEAGADDHRNFVKKAINWALRQVGKRSETLKEKAIETALRIQQQESKAAKWIAMDALRELQNPQTRIRK